MPLYDFRCENCAKDFIDVYAKFEDKVVCEVCNQVMRRLLPHPFIPKAFTPYHCKGLGCEIRSYSDRKAKMKELGAEEIGDETQDSVLRMMEDNRKDVEESAWKKAFPKHKQDEICREFAQLEDSNA